MQVKREGGWIAHTHNLWKLKKSGCRGMDKGRQNWRNCKFLSLSTHLLFSLSTFKTEAMRCWSELTQKSFMILIFSFKRNSSGGDSLLTTPEYWAHKLNLLGLRRPLPENYCKWIWMSWCEALSNWQCQQWHNYMMEVIQISLQTLDTAGDWRNEAGPGGERLGKEQATVFCMLWSCEEMVTRYTLGLGALVRCEISPGTGEAPGGRASRP